jgi:hypothetical protein
MACLLVRRTREPSIMTLGSASPSTCSLRSGMTIHWVAGDAGHDSRPSDTEYVEKGVRVSRMRGINRRTMTLRRVPTPRCATRITKEMTR